MLTDLPTPPWELEHNYPRVYVIFTQSGKRILDGDEYRKNPNRYRMYPIEEVGMPSNFDPDTLCSYKCAVPDGAAQEGSSYVEQTRYVPRTTEERDEFIKKVKLHLVRDIHTQGVPVMHFTDPHITIEFNRRSYLVDIQDLTCLNQYLFPRNNQRKSDIFEVYVKGLMDSPLIVPAVDEHSGELGYLTVEYNIAAMVISRYTDKSREYLNAMNDLCKLIMDTDLCATKLSDLWEKVYGVKAFTGCKIERIKM